MMMAIRMMRIRPMQQYSEIQRETNKSLLAHCPRFFQRTTLMESGERCVHYAAAVSCVHSLGSSRYMQAGHSADGHCIDRYAAATAAAAAAAAAASPAAATLCGCVSLYLPVPVSVCLFPCGPTSPSESTSSPLSESDYLTISL